MQRIIGNAVLRSRPCPADLRTSRILLTSRSHIHLHSTRLAEMWGLSDPSASGCKLKLSHVFLFVIRLWTVTQFKPEDF